MDIYFDSGTREDYDASVAGYEEDEPYFGYETPCDCDTCYSDLLEGNR
jgi:hypothetical protein